MCRFQELVFTKKEYIRVVSIIDIKWLKEIAPHYYNSNDLQDESKKKMPIVAKRGWFDVSYWFCLLLWGSYYYTCEQQ